MREEFVQFLTARDTPDSPPKPERFLTERVEAQGGSDRRLRLFLLAESEANLCQLAPGDGSLRHKARGLSCAIFMCKNIECLFKTSSSILESS